MPFAASAAASGRGSPFHSLAKKSKVMSDVGLYLHDQLCVDLEKLLYLDPSKEEQRLAWQSQADLIKAGLSRFLDLDRSVFYYVKLFVDDGNFMSRHPDYYLTESKKIRGCLAAYRNGSF
ncbi:hypothetical protein [Propionivibrio sp.]|uniref:hypothetical protein n=1 Tax=Propionivibrio sp. TaxID=2212460 RepID=UPI0025EF8087|nr:hypothetical protein [Propionivibrio sp.]MBK7354823.1 hypothetical protein [Propionivibrio sp.]